MTLLKDNNYKDINVALLSLEADIKNKITNFDTSVIDKQLVEINNRIDKINAGDNNTSAQINDIRYEIEGINTKIDANSTKIEDIEQKLSDIFSAENKVTDFNTTTNSGIYYWTTDAANRPSDYGVLLVNKYDGGDSASNLWVNQIAYGTNNKIYFRQNINSTGWTEWKAVAFEGEVNATLTVNGKTYNGSEAVDAGVQTVANGGTGVTTQADINKAFIGNLEEGVSDVTDGTEFVSSWASDNGFSEPGYLNEPYRRKFSTVWNYIKGKISSVLGLTKDNYGGKASTAGTADTVDNYHASDLWRSDGATWNPSANVTMTPSGNGSEWSFDFKNKNGATGTYWQVWDENKQTLLKVDADSGKVSAPYGFVGNLSGKADTAGTAAAILDYYNKNAPIKVRWSGPGIDSADWYPAFSADGSALEPINRANISAGTSDRTTGINYTGESDRCISAEQTSESFNNSSEDWASYIICNHGNGKTYYHQMLRLPFFSDTIQLQRRVGGELKGWKNVAIMENENTWSGRQNFTTAKASNKMVIPIGAPSSLEDGCIWIER